MWVRMMTTFASLWRSPSLLWLLLTGMTLLCGCATLGLEPSKPPVTVSDVIQMTKQGVPAETILDNMRRSQTVYRLTPSQVAQLHEQGVADQVLDYMQQTYLYAVRQDQSLEHWDKWTVGVDGFRYGGPSYGWPPHWWLRDAYAYGSWPGGGNWGDEDDGHEGERHGEHGGYEGRGHGEHGGHGSGGGHGGGGGGGGGHGGR